jgi:HEAT repeat protein
MRRVWLAGVVLLGVAVAPEARPSQDGKPEVKREDLRYDGKSFDQWRDFLRTELKAERRIEGLHALSVFGAHGYAKEAAEVVLEAALKHVKLEAQKRKKAKVGGKSGKGVRSEGEPSDDADVIARAARSLGEIGQPAAALLVGALKHPDGAVRHFAAYTLFGHFETLPAAAAPALAAALQDADPETRRYAVRALDSRFDAVPAVAVPALIRAVQDEDNTVSVLAMMALPRADKGLAALRKAAQDDKLARGLAAALTRLLTTNSDLPRAYTEPIAGLFGALGMGAREAVPALVGIVKGEEAGSRLGAVMALGEIAADAKSAVPALTAVFQNDTAGLRPYAAAALARYGAEAKETLRALDEVAKDKTVDVGLRFAAAVASDCIRGQDEKAFPLFVPLLKDVTAPERANPGKGGFPIKKAAKGGKGGFDGQGFGGFGRTTVDRGATVRALLAAYAQFGVHRVAILDTLGRLGAEASSALPVLEQALESTDPEVRRAAAAAIQRIRPQN